MSGEEQKVRPDELPNGKFLVTAVLPNEQKRSFDLFKHLDLLGLHSLSEVRYVSSSTHFPPIPYKETGRGPNPYGRYYMGIGSGLAVLELNSGDSVALSAVFTLDKSGHSGSPPHVNVSAVAWPVRGDGRDSTKDIGGFHVLPANVEIPLRIADGSKILKLDVLRSKYEIDFRVE